MSNFLGSLHICTLLFDVTVIAPQSAPSTFTVEYLYVDIEKNRAAFDVPASDRAVHGEVFTPLVPEKQVVLTSAMQAEEKRLQKLGVSLRYIKSHRVEEVAKKYRAHLMAKWNLHEGDQDLEHLILYYAATGKIELGGAKFEIAGENNDPFNNDLTHLKK